MAVDIFEHDDRIVDDKADRDRQRHQRQIVEAVAEHVHHGEGTDKRQRHGNARDYRRPQAAQENENDHHNKCDSEQQGELNVGDRGADRLCAVAQDLDLDGRWDRRLQLRQGGLDAVHGLDHIGARQFIHRQQDCRLAVCKGREASVFRCVYRAADVTDAHRSAVLVGDDDVVPGRRIEHLAVVVDRESPGLPIDSSRWADRGRVDDHPAQILERESERGHLYRVDLDAYRRLLLAANIDLGDAGDLAEMLDQDIFGVIVDLGQRHQVGGQGEDQNGCVGRVDLTIGRRRRQVVRKLPARCVNRRLDILCCAVDVAREVELDCDCAVAEYAARRHLRDARDLAELALQRLRDRSGHDLRAGSGELSRYLDRREIDLRQRGHRKQRIGSRSDQKNPRHQQGCRDRPRDKSAGKVHLNFLLRAGKNAADQPFAAGLSTSTRTPGCRRYCPAVTTCSPAVKPSSTIATPLLTRPTLRGRVPPSCRA